MSHRYLGSGVYRRHRCRVISTCFKPLGGVETAGTPRRTADDQLHADSRPATKLVSLPTVTAAVLRVLTEILNAAVRGDVSAFVTLDLSTAFDTVDHGSQLLYDV